MTRDEITVLAAAVLGFAVGVALTSPTITARREAAAIDTEWRILSGATA